MPAYRLINHFASQLDVMCFCLHADVTMRHLSTSDRPVCGQISLPDSRNC